MKVVQFMAQASIGYKFSPFKEIYVKTYDIVLINIPCQYAICHKSKFMLANSMYGAMQVVNKIKFMCQIIAMSWTLNNQVHVTASNYIENQCQLNNRCSVNKVVG